MLYLQTLPWNIKSERRRLVRQVSGNLRFDRRENFTTGDGQEADQSGAVDQGVDRGVNWSIAYFKILAQAHFAAAARPTKTHVENAASTHRPLVSSDSIIYTRARACIQFV